MVWPLLEGDGHVGCDYYWKGEGMFGVTIIGRGRGFLVWPVLEGVCMFGVTLLEGVGMLVWPLLEGVGLFGVTIIGSGWVCLV